MRPGKVKESILKRSVLQPIKGVSSIGEAWTGGAGEERLYGQAGERGCPGQCLKVIPVEGWSLAAGRAVYDTVNALAAEGKPILAPEVKHVTIK
jgi:hypothetical protein